MNNNSLKLFYIDPFLIQNRTHIVDIADKGVVFTSTVAFPEGGGQQGDCGLLRKYNIEGDYVEIPFIDTQKGIGRMLLLKDFPVINVETPIYHVIADNHRDLLCIGDEIEIVIDVNRRAATTINHSGLHIMLMGVESLRPGITSRICGCSITENYGRLDFSVEERFTQDEIHAIEYYANKLITDEVPMVVFHHPDEKEAWYWKCLDTVIPCGGTHLPNTKYLNKIHVARKSRGKGIERLTATFLDAELPLDLFHAEVLR